MSDVINDLAASQIEPDAPVAGREEDGSRSKSSIIATVVNSLKTIAISLEQTNFPDDG